MLRLLLDLVIPVMAIAAFAMVLGLRREVRALAAELARLKGAPAEAPQDATSNAAAPTEEPSAAPEPPPEAEPEPPETPEPTLPAGAPMPAPAFARGLEEHLTQRWLVWLGGIALALGGVFIVKHAVDRGLIGPGVRMTLAVLAGLALVAAGEWLRRRPVASAMGPARPGLVPQALAAGGLVTLFAAFYAAHALYDLLPPTLVFLLLALTAAGGIALSWWQGPFLALLGVAGGFLAPALVSTREPSALALFTYLPALVALAQGVLAWRPWRWLGWVTLAGAAVWPLLWLGEVFRPGDAPALGLHLLAVLALLTLLPGMAPEEGGTRPAGRLARLRLWLRAPAALQGTAAVVVACLALLLVGVDGHGGGSLAVVAALVAFALVAAWRVPRLDLLPWPFAVLALLVLLTWPLGVVPIGWEQWGDPSVALAPTEPLPEALRPFVQAAVVTGLAFALAALAALAFAPRPGAWASHGALVPVLALAVAYAKIAGLRLHLGWATAGLGLALVELVIAERLARHKDRARLTGAIAAHALGVSAALALAATMALEQAWLTVALALQLPAIAWVHARLRVPTLPRIAFALALVVVVRLTLNPHLLDYPLGDVPGLGWMLYGYGIPLAAFLVAARLFRGGDAPRLVVLLESGALLLAVLLVALEIRHLVAGGPFQPFLRPFAESALMSLAWLVGSLGLFRQARLGGGPVPFWGARILAVLALLQLVLVQLLLANPVLTGEPVGAWPIVNLLLVGCALPAALLLLLRRELLRQDMAGPAALAGGLAVVFAFVWLSLELRHAFQGERLSGWTSEAEMYAYSVAWLAFAGVLLLLGMLRQERALRQAGLAVLLGTVAKVFLLDLEALEGLWRAASFLGLGLTLVAVALLYQRFVPPPPPAPPPAEPA